MKTMKTTKTTKTTTGTQARSAVGHPYPRAPHNRLKRGHSLGPGAPAPPLPPAAADRSSVTWVLGLKCGPRLSLDSPVAAGGKCTQGSTGAAAQQHHGFFFRSAFSSLSLRAHSGSSALHFSAVSRDFLASLSLPCRA